MGCCSMRRGALQNSKSQIQTQCKLYKPCLKSQISGFDVQKHLYDRFPSSRLLFKILVLMYKMWLSNSFIYDCYELQPRVSLRVARARNMCRVLLLKGMLSSDCDWNALTWLIFTDHDHQWKLLNLASVSHFGGYIYVKNWLSVFVFSLNTLKQWSALSRSCWVYREGEIYALTWAGHIFMMENKGGRNLKEVVFFHFPSSLSLRSDIPAAFLIDFCLVCFQNSRLHYLLSE